MTYYIPSPPVWFFDDDSEEREDKIRKYSIVRKLLSKGSVTITVHKEDKLLAELIRFLCDELEEKGYTVDWERVSKDKLRLYLCCTKCGARLKTEEELKERLCEKCLTEATLATLIFVLGLLAILIILTWMSGDLARFWEWLMKHLH